MYRSDENSLSLSASQSPEFEANINVDIREDTRAEILDIADYRPEDTSDEPADAEESDDEKESATET
ncbi:hypothetical protein KAI87_01810 [Myxococcota bacterium]|nr:hypothetical protein [Myxococcota bacterium]